MKRIPKTMIGAMIALGLTLAGCGGSTTSKEEFASNFAESASSGDSPFSSDDAQCLGEKIFDEVGEDRMNELNDQFESETFPEELIDPVAKVGPECVAAGDLLKGELGSAGLTPEQTDCIVTSINDDAELNQQVWEAIAASAAGDESKAANLEGAITQTATSCVGG